MYLIPSIEKTYRSVFLEIEEMKIRSVLIHHIPHAQINRGVY